MAQTAPEAERLVNDYATLWNEQDYDRIEDVVSDSFVHATPAAPDGEVRGPDGVAAFMREVTSAFPDFEVTPIEIISRDDLAMVEHEFTMTHEGEFDDIPATGRTVELRSMAKCRTADGKLQELHEYLNMQSVFEQLGVTDDSSPE